MSDVTCAACGRENRDIAKYCRFCGKMLSVSSSAPQTKQAPAASPSQASAPVSAPIQPVSAATTAVPFDYVGHEKIRAELEKIKSNIKFQKKRQSAGVGGAIGTKIFVFKGKTGAGKTLVAKHFIEELRMENCLSSDIITSKEARELSKAYADEYAISRFLSETKPAALVVDNATEKPEYIHELILAASKSTQECVCIIIGNIEGFDDFFSKNAEDRQRVTQDFIFQDLSLEDLSLILMKKLKERGLVFDPALKKHFLSFIQERKNDPSCEYKNGWLIEKDVIPSIDKNQQARLEKLSNATNEDFKTIIAEDLPLKNKPRTTDEILAELDAMIGMTDVKKAVREIANKIQIQKEQEEKDGTKSAGEGNNIVITGNPGTGKTTIVRMLGSLFSAIGLLESETVIEVNGNDLKGSFLGQSKDKVNEKCDEALGGILFVDEAYVLADTKRGSGAADEFAKEAVEILMTRLENDRTKFVGVVAGYEKEMNVFLDKVNPGMRRRFKHYLNLSDYNAEELLAIFKQMVKKAGYTMTAEAGEVAKKAITDMFNNKGPNFGNAGEIRVFFEKTTSKQATRLASLSKEERADKLKTIEACDFPIEIKEERSVDDILAELDAMIGMTDVKKAVREIANKIQIQKEQEEKDGTKGAGEGNNIVITGNPGTGKTTIVRTLGALFNAIGLLSTDKVIEVNGNDLKGTFVGESKEKTNNKCDEARGGILFVDEAYVLADVQRGGPADSFAKEAVEILMTRFENDRTKFVGVVAGYEKEMNVFLDKVNPGMRRRFKHYLHLSDYNAEELLAIFNQMVKKAGYTLTAEAGEAAKASIKDMFNNKGPNFGNAGEIRVFFEKTTSKQATRLSALSKEERSDKLKTIEACDFPVEKREERSVDEILAELDAMIGMTDVKKAVREIANKIQIQKEQDEKDGTKSVGEGNNIVLTGNPGTGKTTIVRTLGALFNAIGLLSTDNVIEVNGNDLKGVYVGESKEKTNNKCDEARGGILFVDEAYVLADTQRGGAADSFAKEAVETLMTRLENDRTKFVGVVAGYKKEMEVFLDKVNPGMRRRFKHYLHLSDYNAEELIAIFNSMVKKAGYTLTPDANKAAKAAITGMFKNKGPNFGNAGEIRVFFEKATSRQATRLAALSKEERADKLKTIEACDIPVKDGGAK